MSIFAADSKLTVVLNTIGNLMVLNVLALICMQIKDILRMFALEWQLARGSVVLLPLLLVLVLAGSWLYGRRKGGAPQ